MKTLREIVGNTFNPNLKLEPRVAKERKIFNDTSVPKELFKNIYADSEYDALFKGSNVKQTAREAERHGYSLGNDAKVYESSDWNPSINKQVQNLLDRYPPSAEGIKRKAKKRAEEKAKIDAELKKGLERMHPRVADSIRKATEELYDRKK